MNSLRCRDSGSRVWDRPAVVGHRLTSFLVKFNSARHQNKETQRETKKRKSKIKKEEEVQIKPHGCRRPGRGKVYISGKDGASYFYLFWALWRRRHPYKEQRFTELRQNSQNSMRNSGRELGQLFGCISLDWDDGVSVSVLSEPTIGPLHDPRQSPTPLSPYPSIQYLFVDDRSPI